MGRTTVVFGGTVTVNGPAGPTEVNLLPRFVTAQSSDLTRWTYQTTSQKRWQWTITLGDLTTAQKVALETFFADTAKGPLGTFTYQHTDETTYTNVRFIDTELQFSRVNDNHWSVTIHLESSATINS